MGPKAITFDSILRFVKTVRSCRSTMKGIKAKPGHAPTRMPDANAADAVTVRGCKPDMQKTGSETQLRPVDTSSGQPEARPHL